MAVDTPAKIIILGAGPIGLEAALYARFLGYDVVVYDRGAAAENVRRWGHVRMFSPFRLNHSPLGLAAITAQDEHYVPPAAEDCLTGHEWHARYLQPLADTDLIADHLRLQTEVLSVARPDLLKGDLAGDDERGNAMLQVLARGPDGKETYDEADVVIDATGVFANPNWSGDGGAPALGERSLRAAGRIEYRLPDVLGSERERFAGKHTLVVGGGHSAATNVRGLAELAGQVPGTKITWLMRREPPLAGPLPHFKDDPLPARARLAAEAAALAAGKNPAVTLLPGGRIHALAYDETADCWEVEIIGEHAGKHRFDRFIANPGFRPDRSLYEELQVHECYATGGPMKLAAALAEKPAGDCLQIGGAGPQTLMTTEPHFYILGAKSYGRRSDFLFAAGLVQIRDLFTIIGDRETLDLYGGAVRLTE